ncbi:TetR/AcrR family transcriptional regulator [Streptomyces sp. Agncl-13]|uniref:TetR/AcrR family transcriptional regulator n=1 Tax=Streptomyces sp. Agncl-13 TaxID=3400628 RepID=UPI003A83A118
MTGSPPGGDRIGEVSDGAPRAVAGKRPGRRRLVDRRSVIDTVAELGFHEITVSSVAHRLGVRPSTLYRYFPTREKLLADAVDAQFERSAWPDDCAEWRRHLAAQAWALWEVYAHHPGLAQAVTALPETPPSLTRHIDRTAVHLLDLGFTTDAAVLAVDVIGELTLDTFLLGRITGKQPTGAAGAGVDRRARVAAAAPLMDARLRHLIEEIVAAEPHAWFARKLDLVLDGLAARAPGRTTPTTRQDRGGHGRSVATP